MNHSMRMLKAMALLSSLAFLFVFGTAGCSTTKEATAAQVQITPVPPAPQPASKPAIDYGKIEAAVKRSEAAASLAEAAAKKAELAAQKAEIASGKADLASGKAEKAAEKAEAMANKAESIFNKKMKK